MLDQHKEAFIKLAIQSSVLKFGQYKLKSGRNSPYFFNAGLFYEGEALRQLGQFYAHVLIENHVTFKHLFGPAYKGLPLATTTACALAEKGINITVTFNRKEMKDHGEGGVLIGAPLHGETVIIDDVITAGTAFREAQQMIVENGGTVKAVVIALDRCERGKGEHSTLQEIKNQGIAVYSLITFFDLVHYLEGIGELTLVEKLNKYHGEYGAHGSQGCLV